MTDKGFCDIFDLLYRLGVSANYAGFLQTACAVELCQAEPERLLLVTKRVYPEVARLCGTSSWNAVERNIRTACGIVWEKNRCLLERLARKPLQQKPYNAQFLAILLYSYTEIPGGTELMDRFLPAFSRKGASGNGEKAEKHGSKKCR